MTTGRYTRRSALGLGGASLAALLAACARQPSERSGPRRQSTIGDSSANLRMWNWPDYVDADVLAEFGNIHGSVGYDDSLDDNGAVADQFKDGTIRQFDIVVPTYWLAARLIAAEKVEPLPLDRIPNHTNIDTAFLRPSWDRGARFHMPWQSAITGIAYNSEKFPNGIESLKQFFTEAKTARVSLLSEMRDTVALMMLANDADPSQATVAAADAAIESLQALSSATVRYAGNDYLELLRDGSVDAALGWSGDIAQLQQEAGGGKFRFVIPKEGGMQFFDTMVIPNAAPNGRAIAAFMDWVYDPVNAARITASVQYVSPVVGVRDELTKLGGDAAKLADNPLLFPDDATRQRLFTWGGMSADDEDLLDATFGRLAQA
jgi:spermidine/putrescine transport system substrate-binding protein